MPLDTPGGKVKIEKKVMNEIKREIPIITINILNFSARRRKSVVVLIIFFLSIYDFEFSSIPRINP
jgi:hypothetical protein